MKIGGRRNKPITETQLVSLADITFLIIFFFMLTSSFMRDKVKVNLPQVPKMVETKSVQAVAIDSTGGIHLNGQAVDTPASLELQLRELLAGKTKDDELEVRLRCERSLPYKDYKKVLEAIGNAGGIIAVMHEVTPGVPVSTGTSGNSGAAGTNAAPGGGR